MKLNHFVPCLLFFVLISNASTLLGQSVLLHGAGLGTDERLYALEMEKVLDSQGKVKTFERMSTYSKALRQWIASQTSSQESALSELQGKLSTLKKDEFEATADFKKRQQNAKNSVQEAKELLAEAESKAIKTFPQKAERDAGEIFCVLLDAFPEYNADKREFSCSIHSSKHSETKRNTGSEYDVEIVQVMTPDGIPSKLVIKNIPDVETAKAIKSQMKGLRIRGDVHVTQTREKQTDSFFDSIAKGGIIETWYTRSYEIRFREGYMIELVGLPETLKLDSVVAEIDYEK